MEPMWRHNYQVARRIHVVSGGGQCILQALVKLRLRVDELLQSLFFIFTLQSAVWLEFGVMPCNHMKG